MLMKQFARSLFTVGVILIVTMVALIAMDTGVISSGKRNAGRSSPSLKTSAHERPTASSSSSKPSRQHMVGEDKRIWPGKETKEYFFNLEDKQNLFKIDGLETNDSRPYLNPTKVPNTFYYIWCGRKPFWYKNYLGLLSVIRVMRPDNIVFLYDHWPQLEEYMYSTWLDELMRNYPFISPVNITNPKVCRNWGENSRPKFSYVLDVLKEFGGVYITEGTMLLKPLNLNKDIEIRWDTDSEKGYILATKETLAKMSEIDVWKMGKSRCPNITMSTEMILHIDKIIYDLPEKTLKQIENGDVCMRIDGRHYPKDFWTRDDIIGKKVRWIMYGTTEIRQAKPNPEVVIPNIAHMIWVGGGTEEELRMDYLFYLSVLSLVYIQEVEHLYIHGDTPPTGEYWKKVEKLPQVSFRYRNSQGMQIYGQPIAQQWHYWKAAHWSDILRVDIMLRWGGIYIDTDAILIRKMEDELMKYDTVIHYSFARRPPYPDTFVNGFLVTKPASQFFERFQQSMRHYLDGDWMYNSLLVPYKLIERYPYIVHIEPHLQVVCLYEKCHPTWAPNFKNMSVNHLNSNSLPNWRLDSHVYHFCSDSTPTALMNETALKNAPQDDMFAQMGRLIVEKAGIKL